ncbi:hypothetical protein BS333_07175 [Vibrio azureus]|nr:hypothetical protein BS333_07175 [Vibrio azureus]
MTFKLKINLRIYKLIYLLRNSYNDLCYQMAIKFFQFENYIKKRYWSVFTLFYYFDLKLRYFDSLFVLKISQCKEHKNV